MHWLFLLTQKPVGVIRIVKHGSLQTSSSESKELNAAIMLWGADNARYGKLKDELVNNFTKGSKTHPQNTDKFFSLMKIY